MSTPQSGRKSKKNLSVQQPSPAIFRREPNTPDEFGSPPLNMIAKSVFSHTPVEHPIGEDISEFEISRSPVNYVEDSVEHVEPSADHMYISSSSRDFDGHDSHSSRHVHSPKLSPNSATAHITFADTSSVHQFYEKQANKSALDAYHSPSDLRDSLKKAATPEQLMFEHLSTASSVSSDDYAGGDGRSWQSKYSFKYGDIAWSQSDILFPFWPVNVIDPEHLPPDQKALYLGSGSGSATGSGSAKLVNAQRKKIPVVQYATGDVHLVHPSKLKDYKSYREVYSKQDKMSAIMKVVFAKAVRLADEDIEKDPEYRVGGASGPPLQSSNSPSTSAASTPIKKKKSPYFGSDTAVGIVPAPAPFSAPSSASSSPNKASVLPSVVPSVPPLSPVREESRETVVEVVESPVPAETSHDLSSLGPSAVAALNISKYSEGQYECGAEEDVDALLAELVADEEPAVQTSHVEDEKNESVDPAGLVDPPLVDSDGREQLDVVEGSVHSDPTVVEDTNSTYLDESAPFGEGKPILHSKSVDLSSSSRDVLESDLKLPLNPRGIAMGGRGVPSFNLYLSDSDTASEFMSGAPTRSLDITPNLSPQTNNVGDVASAASATHATFLAPPPVEHVAEGEPTAADEIPSVEIGLSAEDDGGECRDVPEESAFFEITISEEVTVEEEPVVVEELSVHVISEPVVESVPTTVVVSTDDSPISAVTEPSVMSEFISASAPPPALAPPPFTAPRVTAAVTAAADLFGAPSPFSGPPVGAAAADLFGVPPPSKVVTSFQAPAAAPVAAAPVAAAPVAAAPVAAAPVAAAPVAAAPVAKASAADLFAAPPAASTVFGAPALTPQPMKPAKTVAAAGDAANLFGGPSLPPTAAGGAHGGKPVVVVKKTAPSSDSASLFGSSGSSGSTGLFSGPTAAPVAAAPVAHSPAKAVRGVSGTADSLFGSSSNSDAASLFGSSTVPSFSAPPATKNASQSASAAASLFDAPSRGGAVDAGTLFGAAPPSVPPTSQSREPNNAAPPIANIFQASPSSNVSDFFGAPPAVFPPAAVGGSRTTAPFAPPQVTALAEVQTVAAPSVSTLPVETSIGVNVKATDFFGSAPMTPRGPGTGSGSVSPKLAGSMSPKDEAADFFGGGEMEITSSSSASLVFGGPVTPSKVSPPPAAVSISPPRVETSSAVSAFQSDVPASDFFASEAEVSATQVAQAPSDAWVPPVKHTLSVDVPTEIISGGPVTAEDYACGFVDVDLNTPSPLPQDTPKPSAEPTPVETAPVNLSPPLTSSSLPPMSPLEVPQKAPTSAKFVGRAPVVSGASPFDVSSPSVKSVDSLFGSAPPAPVGSGMSSFLPPPAAATGVATAAALFGGPTAADLKATDVFSSLPPAAPVPQSSGTPRVTAPTGVPTAGGVKKKAPASAADIFSGAAPVAQPTTHDILSGPPPAPGVKVSAKNPNPFSVPSVSAGGSEKVLSPEQMAPAPEPKVAAPTSAKKPSKSSAAPPAPGMIPTPHGFVPSKSTQSAPAAAPAAAKVFAPLVSHAVLNSLVAVQPESVVPEPVVVAPPVEPAAPQPASLSSLMTPSAGPPRPHGASAGPSRSSSSGASAFPPLPSTAAVSTPRAVPKKIMKPPAAIASFGFGGRLLTMFPVAQVPINPMLMTPDQQARPYLPGPLRVQATIDVVKQFCFMGSSSDSTADEDTTSLSLLGHKQEAVEFCKLLTAFSGPLSASVASNLPLDTRISSFIQSHIRKPTSCCLSDNYFSDDGTAAKGAVNRHSITTSEQLLWSLFHIMSESNGNLSSEEGCSNPDSPESKIVALLSGSDRAMVLPALEGMHRSFVEEIKKNSDPSSSSSREDPQYQSTIESLLVRGQREEALTLAIGRKDWTLAMLIGCVCGTEKYHSVVKQFADSQYPKESPLHLLSLIYSNQARQHLIPSALVSPQGGANNQEAAGKKFIPYTFEKTASNANIAASGGSAEAPETALTLWRSHLSAIIANKSADWKDLSRFLGFRLLSESKDIMASHFAYLCSGSVPNYPVGAVEGAAGLSKRLGNFSLVGCNGTIPRHQNIADVVSVSSLRMTELLEYFLLKAISAAQSSASAGGTGGDKSAGIASIGKSLTNLFGFGGSSNAPSDSAAPASGKSEAASSSANSEEMAKLIAQLKVKLVRVRAVMCPLKLRFALVLADFGLMKEAVAYAQEVRSVIMETAAYVNNGSAAAAAAASSGSAKAVSNQASSKSKKNPPVHAKGGAGTASGPSPSPASGVASNQAKSFNGVRPVNNRVIKVVEEFLERVSPGERGGGGGGVMSSGVGGVGTGGPPTGPAGSGPSSDSKGGWGLGSMIGSINLKDLVDGGEASPAAASASGPPPTGSGSKPPTPQHSTAAAAAAHQGPPPAMYSQAAVPPSSSSGAPLAGPWGAAAPLPGPGNRVTPPPSSVNLMKFSNPQATSAIPGVAPPQGQHHRSLHSGGSENDFFVDVDLMSDKSQHSGAPSHSNSSNALFDQFHPQQQPSSAPSAPSAGGPWGQSGSTPPAQQYYSRGAVPGGADPFSSSQQSQYQQPMSQQGPGPNFSGGFPPQSYMSGTNLDQMNGSNNSSTKVSTSSKGPAAAPSPTASGRSASTSSASTAAAAAAAPVAGGGGLFGGLRKGLINMMYGNDVKLVNEENIGGKMEAYFDKALNKWVFPGEDPANATPDPSSMPPPTMPSHNSLASMSSPNMSLGSGGAGTDPSAGGGYDPLAAMMAPPARRIPSIASYSSMPPAAPSTDLDPLAAMMAPPSLGRYSQVSSGGGPAAPGGGPVAPPVNMWKPPSGGNQFMQVPSSGSFGGAPAFQSVSLSLSDNDAISLEHPPASSEGPPPRICFSDFVNSVSAVQLKTQLDPITKNCSIFGGKVGMYFDQAKNAYIDKETGEVIFQEGSENTASVTVDGVDLGMDNIYELSARQQNKSVFEIDNGDGFEGNRITGREGNYMSVDEDEIAQQRAILNLYSTTDEDGVQRSDDWNFARTLQMLEFEISNEMVEGYGGDFNEKEYRASRSCRRQLMTVSFLICLIQIAFMIAMIQIAGYAPKSENPLIGPPVYIMVRFGAKEAGLIVVKKEWWRLLSTMMLHAGIFHILPNVAIQLRVGGYLNLVYGTPKWLFIYIMSGIFGCMMSCIFIPESVGVGSSGALMGMLSSWIVWIIFRWKKIPRECKRQRNCQLFIVLASVVITLATSFTPNVDWAAHAGGTVQGVLWGIVLLSNELDNNRNKMWGRVVAGAIAVGLLIYSLYYMIVLLHPSTANFWYWDMNDDWGR